MEPTQQAVIRADSHKVTVSGGMTIIPAANVLGGFGGGTGNVSAGASPVGGGFGLCATPAGVYVIKGETVTWQPLLNLNRVILGGQFVAIVLLPTLRSIVRARASRLPGLAALVVRSARSGRGRWRRARR